MNKRIHVLLVEDNPADADLTREALDLSKLQLDLSVVMDGQDAMDFLRRSGKHAHEATPDLVLLDLNLPKMNGRQVLEAIKTDPKLRRLPVVILTSSDAESDIMQSYDLGANCYVKKPVDLKAFEIIVKAVNNFWFTIVKLPTQE